MDPVGKILGEGQRVFMLERGLGPRWLEVKVVKDMGKKVKVTHPANPVWAPGTLADKKTYPDLIIDKSDIRLKR